MLLGTSDVCLVITTSKPAPDRVATANYQTLNHTSWEVHIQALLLSLSSVISIC